MPALHLRRRRAAWALTLACVASAVAGFAAAAASPRAHRSSARLQLRSFRSHALRGTEHLAVYLPRGYHESGRHYPVIYFLHGLPGRPTSYEGPRIRRLGRSVDRSGRQAIVVGIQGARRGDTDPEWHDWGPGRDWETAAAHEVPRYIDRRYRTIARRGGRALIGLSAGGYGAAIIGFRHPATFSVVESWSGYFHPTTLDGDAPRDVGDNRANRLASVHSYVRHALAIYARHRTFFGFYVGDRDLRFAKENRQLDRELTHHRVAHVFAVYPGTHSGALWDSHEDRWIVTALDHLARSHRVTVSGPGGGAAAPGGS
jgi:enterochelin esterase-like enzyme